MKIINFTNTGKIKMRLIAKQKRDHSKPNVHESRFENKKTLTTS